VLSPHSLNCDAIEVLSLDAVSYALMAWFCDLISLYKRLDSSGCCTPRRDERPKWCFELDLWSEVFSLRLERMEWERPMFL